MRNISIWSLGAAALLATSGVAASPIVFTAQVSNITFFDYVTQTSTPLPGTRTLNFSFDPSALGSTTTSTNEHLAIGSGSTIDSLFSAQIPFPLPQVDSFWYTVVANYAGPQVLHKSVTVKNRGTSGGGNGAINGYQVYLTSTSESNDTGSRYFMTDPEEILSYFTRPNANLYFQENYYVAVPNGSGGYSYPVNGVWQSSSITVSVQAIPEPSTLFLFMFGLLAISRLYNRRAARPPLAAA